MLGASGAQARGGLGDPFFPDSGNPGYDVSRYGVHLAFVPKTAGLRATATVAATASRRLGRFSLDLAGLRVTGVTVDGAAARFSRGEGKLRIVPRAPVEAGARFVVRIRYRGAPAPTFDPDGSIEGWLPTEDGVVTLSEPVGTASWLPCNNTPADKAAFHVELTVPEPLKGVSNGRLLAVRRHDGRRTFVWEEAQPMAPYLALVDIGLGKLTKSRIAGLPAWTFLDASTETRARRALRSLPGIVRFYSRAFGPYPFDALGSVVDPVFVTYGALETQTRPVYVVEPPESIVAHEMAHQWFGDAVGLTRWPETWLNEGFATWAEWYFAERHGGRSVQAVFERLYRAPRSAKVLWDPPPGRPAPKSLFANSVYERGGMALQALRREIGTEALLRILRRWVAEHRYGNATIPQFIALAEEVSGRRLDAFFDDWLYRRGKPLGYG